MTEQKNIRRDLECLEGCDMAQKLLFMELKSCELSEKIAV